jgi:hypothetical protein
MLSADALDLFRHHLPMDGRIAVDDSNREACRELAREGLLVVGHSFTGGREAFYVPTAAGRKLAEVLERMPTAPSPSGCALPRP